MDKRARRREEPAELGGAVRGVAAVMQIVRDAPGREIDRSFDLRSPNVSAVDRLNGPPTTAEP
jgi:hypothetical protein